MQQTDRTPEPPKTNEPEPPDERIVWLVPRPRPALQHLPDLPDEDDDDDPGPAAA
jgi:hypothetical protein